MLEELSQGTQDDALMAYQIAFDLYESATQQFLNNVVQAVRKTAPIPAAVTIAGSSSKGRCFRFINYSKNIRIKFKRLYF